MVRNFQNTFGGTHLKGAVRLTTLCRRIGDDGTSFLLKVQSHIQSHLFNLFRVDLWGDLTQEGAQFSNILVGPVSSCLTLLHCCIGILPKPFIPEMCQKFLGFSQISKSNNGPLVEGVSEILKDNEAVASDISL